MLTRFRYSIASGGCLLKLFIKCGLTDCISLQRFMCLDLVALDSFNSEEQVLLLLGEHYCGLRNVSLNEVDREIQCRDNGLFVTILC